ncbi:hypothetical protein OOT46_28160 [Aquabacterium sp. A7-Y]|uniref:hypothetical protein n=1 Tax=Aquabacterium sp. A7-Y TaxID=1349605 RepID=UPI00223D4FE2|nr:hypothetical protein [Aquabacterium sp. A7-Y]MCW7541677.1 hypothetical protein [Aquabacterium sp. A7-Y]
MESLIEVPDGLGVDVAETRARIIQQLAAEGRAGVRLLSEEIRRIDYFGGDAHRVAFLRVTASYEHPMYPKESRSLDRTVVAFSRDSGATWTFNVPSCLSTDTVAAFVPGYAGVPPITEQGLP